MAHWTSIASYAKPDELTQFLLVTNTTHCCQLCISYIDKTKLDGCIVWNAHNTVLGSKRLAICATA